jgi:hypothetical protein
MGNKFVIRYIEMKKCGSLTELGRRPETCVTIDIEQRNNSTGIHQRPSDGGTNQGCATADHGDLIL